MSCVILDRGIDLCMGAVYGVDWFLNIYNFDNLDASCAYACLHIY